MKSYLLILDCMTNKNILIKKDIIKKRDGVAILDLEKYQKLERKLEEYEKKETIEKFREI